MEYRIDCTGWDREKIMEVFSGLPNHTTAQIVLYVEKTKKEDSLEIIVAGYLNKLGIQPHLKGYGYLKYGVARCVEHIEDLESVTKCLYPGIAKKYHTTAGKVEHGIRHAIQRAWESEKNELWEIVFGRGYLLRSSKPTNSQFIATLTDFILTNN